MPLFPAPSSDAMPPDSEIEVQIMRLGEALWRATQGQTPGIFNLRFWHGLMLDWAMRDPSFKTDLFRFVDVLPTLQSTEQVTHHIHAYLLRPGRRLPKTLELALQAATHKWTSGVGTWAIRRNVTDLAHRFIAGEDVAHALPALRALQRQGIGFTADLLGEATLSQAEADACQARYLALVDRLTTEVTAWPANPLLDRNHLGPIPRVNISLKISALEPNLDPAQRAASVRRLLERVLPIFRRARQLGAFINVDMEQWNLHAITMDLFEQVALHPELRQWPHLGLAVQAYLRPARRDVERLLDLARHRGAPLTVRLVKGAYWDAEVVRSRQFGTPCPVFLEKSQTDQNFEALSLFLLENIEHLHPAFATHNLRSITHVLARAARLELPPGACEFQMIHGMAEPERAALRAMGRRVRAYAPIGELLPGMAYLVRRLLENTANSGFLRLSYHEKVNLKTLLAPPEQCGLRNVDGGIQSESSNLKSETPTSHSALRIPHFSNCPYTDFADPARAAELAAAVELVGASLPLAVPVAVSGQARGGRDEALHRPCPGEPGRTVATLSQATPADADDAIQAALAAWPAWRDRPLEDRASLLEALAERLTVDRAALAALEIWETGRPWPAADADVAAAIDHCRYDALQARLELAPQTLGEVPGEQNTILYEGRGPTAVLASWDEPLAGLAGMAAAALVAGNPVLLHPAGQAAAVAHAFYRHLIRAGFPADVAQFLPGGGDVADRLATHPAVAQVAFARPRAAGLRLCEQAARIQPGQLQARRVIGLGGGKSAILIDEDADLDEAVAGTLQSAFGYSGQSRGACSLAIVTAGVAPRFIERLTAAARSLPAGPVIDEEAWRRLGEVIGNPGPGVTVHYRGPANARGPEEAWSVAPAIFEVREAQHRLMQEEFCGPILTLYRAATFEDTLRVAAVTEGAPAGGVYSRDPAHLDLARARFRVGNLYLNRPITGARVGRQPGGGSVMSGLGAPAGSPGYLLQFVQARCVTDNTTRHGFTPDVTA